ncbi:hypothetical protein C8Q75DRAFT_51084 [Abortiporus biennis]|nr:hypothetical protein C8Q75DRAFT_51084 [Abortiporus biennis]
MAYHYSVINYSRPSALLNVTWSFPIDTLVTSISDTLVRSVYTHRIWKLSKNKWLTGGVILLSITGLALCITIAIQSLQSRTYANFLKLRSSITAAFAVTAGTDTLIAIILCYELLSRRTGMKRTDSQLQTLIMYAVQTATLTSFIAAAALITFVTMENNLIFVGIFFAIPKLFFNSLMATLIGRRRLRQKFDERVMPSTIHFASILDLQLPGPEEEGGNSQTVMVEHSSQPSFGSHSMGRHPDDDVSLHQLQDFKPISEYSTHLPEKYDENGERFLRRVLSA